jgi:hypothetical protein
MTPAGRLQIVSESPKDGPSTEDPPMSWIQLGDHKIWGQPWDGGGSIVSSIVAPDGSQQVLIEISPLGWACPFYHRILVISDKGLIGASGSFGYCVGVTEVRKVPGGLDIYFYSDPLHVRPRVMLRDGWVTDNDGKSVAFAFAGLPEILPHVGEHPAELLRLSSVSERVKAVTGNQFAAFKDSFAIGIASHILGDVLIADAGKSDMIDTAASALFMNVFTNDTYAAILRNGVATIYGVHGSNKPPESVSDWIKAHWHVKNPIVAR